MASSKSKQPVFLRRGLPGQLRLRRNRREREKTESQIDDALCASFKRLKTDGSRVERLENRAQMTLKHKTDPIQEEEEEDKLFDWIAPMQRICLCDKIGNQRGVMHTGRVCGYHRQRDNGLPSRQACLNLSDAFRNYRPVLRESRLPVSDKEQPSKGGVLKSARFVFQQVRTGEEGKGSVQVTSPLSLNSRSRTDSASKKDSSAEEKEEGGNEEVPVFASAACGCLPSFTSVLSDSGASSLLPPDTDTPPTPVFVGLRHTPHASRLPHARGSTAILSPLLSPEGDEAVGASASLSRVSVNRSCSQEARIEDDHSVDELAAYFEHFVHIPRDMSFMAQMMYM